ncbi:hypothetical protein VLK81_05530 [Citroniella saccharovorans]|uniref:Lipoprotein n=1 Tax=Citroniella saccharovorans TaxID=2053367 RepID=A0AAW9MV33_9FIRM|nr:hypothetical protein [Citroniella saccharovorans]MEB3429474.1 hypothetical protein [Citroniella saccharovorans]
MRRKNIIYYFLGIIILLSSCNKEINSKDYKSFDHFGYYDTSQHTLAETEDGYYTLYMGLLNYIDPATKKAYLISKEKYSIDDLLNDEELREKSDAFYGEDSNVFYDRGELFIDNRESLIKVDPENVTAEKISNLRFHNRSILKDGKFFYNVISTDSESLDEKIYEFDLKTKKENLFLSNDKLDKKLNNIQWIYYEDGNLYLNPFDYYSKDVILKIDVLSKNIECIESFSDKFAFQNIFFKDKNLYFAEYEKSDTLKVDRKIEYYQYMGKDKEPKKVGSSIFPYIISSNGSTEFNTVVNGLPILKTDERFKNLLKDYSYKIIVDGKEYHLDEKYFLNNAVFTGTINSKGEPVVYASDLGKVFLFDENREAVDVFAN